MIILITSEVEIFVKMVEIIKRIPEILEREPWKQGAHFYVRVAGDWVVKQPKKLQSSNGQWYRHKDPKEVIDIYEKLKKLDLELLRLPMIIHLKKYDVLIQAYIEGRELQENMDRFLFSKLNEEYERKKEEHGLPKGFYRLQYRNIIVNKLSNWLVDPD